MEGLSKEAWEERLCSYSRSAHAMRRTSVVEEMPALYQEQYSVGRGFMQGWLARYGPRMLAERTALLERAGAVSPSPMVVIHGDVLLASVVLDLAGPHAATGEQRLVALLDQEYEWFLRTYPEPREFDYHVSSWSRFEPASEALLAKARERGHVLQAERKYFNHLTGTLWGPRRGLEAENLWGWDGVKLELVEEALTHVRF
ncbi:hypothetical protein [Hyalangium rubrum]|uniref:Uncharacterized protein n=1 Tax=Hyalangium rubrum TaxID=3103134 RepID=A0ABU5HIU4_9BACT|nr:hypothetical protein [Hyalangium sp. s54d21]MDY7232737.1 hypothetical protein [Hyalangium sp. s54d21]